MAAIAGPEQPFQAFLDEHSEAVVVFLRGLLGPHEAEDCAQETFLAALRAFPRFDGRNPKAWILTIARNKAIDSARAGQRRPETLNANHARVADPASSAGLGGGIWSAVSRLPESQRSALVLRFALDLRYRDIGAALECSEAAARQRVASALSALRADPTTKESR